MTISEYYLTESQVNTIAADIVDSNDITDRDQIPGLIWDYPAMGEYAAVSRIQVGQAIELLLMERK